MDRRTALVYAALLLACVAAVECQWRPITPVAYSTDYKLTYPDAMRGQVFPGHMWEDSNKNLRKTYIVDGTATVSFLERNETIYTGNSTSNCYYTAGQNTYIPLWGWVDSSSPTGTDSAYKCNRFTYKFMRIIEVTGCFSNPTTPVYLNVTLPGNQGMGPFADFILYFRNYQNGPQSASVFEVPPRCQRSAVLPSTTVLTSFVSLFTRLFGYK